MASGSRERPERPPGQLDLFTGFGEPEVATRPGSDLVIRPADHGADRLLPRSEALTATPPPGLAAVAADPWVRQLEAAADMEALRRVVLGCRRCPLRAGCTQVVFGEGNPRARVMVVGEGPGRNEDLQGRPFVGAAGQLLDRMLAAIGLDRQGVYIANVVKCRPPGNRVPTPQEAEACWPNLRRQIELIQPQVILCVGSTAVRRLIDPRAGITAVRGRWFEREGIRYLATFHPAALLRDPSKKRLAWEDLQKLQAALRSGPEPAAGTAGPAGEELRRT